MAAKLVWRCIICSTEADGRPPRHCPTCGTPASRWRLMVNRAPSPPPPPEVPEAAEAPAEEELPAVTVEISETEAEAEAAT